MADVSAASPELGEVNATDLIWDMELAGLGKSAIAKYLPLKEETLRQTIAKAVPPRTVAVNLKAFDLGRGA